MADIIVSADIDAFMQAANDAAARTELGLTALATTTPGTGIATALALNVGSAGAPVLFNGAGGTPSSMVGTNISGTAASLTAGTASAVAVGGITGLGTGVATLLATFSSANLATALTTKTGTGLNVFGTSPTFSTSVVTDSTTLAVFNTIATTVNAFGAATTLNIGAAAATVLNFGGFTSAAELRFLEPSGSGTNYSGFKQPALASSITYLFPSDAPANGDVLTAQSNGTLSWETPSGAANAVTAASTAAGAGLLWVSGGADRSATATDTVTTVNTTNLTAASVLPTANDGAALGASGTAFSDLFLASGAVINWNAGNLTLTHSAGVLTSNGAYVGTVGTFSATTSLLLGTAGSAVGNIGFRNATSGTATVAPPTGALGTYTVTLPNAASTLPIFGQQITFAGPTAARTITLPDENFSVGFRGVPQNAKTGSYTLLATDAGRVIPNTTGGWTVNNSVHTAGDVITLYNDSGSSQNITAGTITTMRLAGTATTGTRALAQRGLATLYFQTASEVIVSGAGVT